MTSNVPAPTPIATAIARLPTTVSIGYLDNIRNPNLKSSQDSPMRIRPPRRRSRHRSTTKCRVNDIVCPQ